MVSSAANFATEEQVVYFSTLSPPFVFKVAISLFVCSFRAFSYAIRAVASHLKIS